MTGAQERTAPEQPTSHLTGPAHSTENVTGPAPMTGAQHSQRAEALIAQARQSDPDRSAQLIAEAQVHATLALAAGGDDRPPSLWYPVLVLLVAVWFAGLAIFAYGGLNHWYRPVTLTATTNNLAALQDLTMSGENGSTVAWTGQGFVRQLTIDGPAQGETEVILPVPTSDCQKMVKMLGLQEACRPGQPLKISSKLMISWSRADSVSISPNALPADLDIVPSLARPSALGVVLAPLANNSAPAGPNSMPSVCFEKPGITSGAMLTVVDGTGNKYVYHGPQWPTVCAPGLAGFGISVIVDWPVLDFAGINTFGLCASALDGTVQGLTGQVNLGHGPTTVLNDPTVVSLQARSPDPLVASLDIGQLSCTSAQTSSPACSAAQSSGSLAVCTQAATGVLTSSGQLVPSEWTRDSPFIVPLFGGLIAALVVSPLGVSVQAFMDVLKRLRWQGLRRSREPVDAASKTPQTGGQNAP